MKSKKGAYPIDLSLLRADAVVQIVDALAQLVEHLCGLQVAIGVIRDTELGSGCRSYCVKMSPDNKVEPQRIWLGASIISYSSQD